MTTLAASDVIAFDKTTLDNGLRVVTSAMPHTRAVSIGLFVGVGSRYEEDGKAGVSHFIEHLVFKGTERRPTPKEISGAVEGVGGVINAGTEHELTVYWCKVALPFMEEVLDLLVDMMRSPRCDPDDVERERLVLLEEQRMVNDHPGYQVDTLLDQMLWPDHPLGRDVSGTEESVASITRDGLLDHLSTFYTPANTVISVAGNVDHANVVRLVDCLCDGWESHQAAAWEPFLDGQSDPQFRLLRRRSEQTHLSIGLPGHAMNHPDQYALGLLSVVLGEGMSSRLFMEVRENQGLAYDIHSSASNFQDCGAFTISAGVDPKRAHAALETIIAEVSRLKDGVPEEELDKAKRLTVGRLLLRMEDTRAVSSWMGSQQLLMGRVFDVDEVVDRVDAVTPADLLRVADELLVTDKLNVAVVGPHRGESGFQRHLAL